MNPQFWRGKRVFLTGHTGFKGGWLSLCLQHMGAHTTGYALVAPTQPSLFEQARVAQGMTSVIGDVRDGAQLARAMAEAAPEIVIHMAAQPLVRRSYADPVQTYSTNVMGTVHLFEAVRQTPSVRAMVNVTTDKCYENHEWIWGYRENEALGGHDPYSSSKACAELVTSAYRNSFFSTGAHTVAVASARAGNVIGGGDYADDRLLPDMLKAYQARQPVVLRNPGAVRPWQHVLEPLRGYLTLAERLYEHGAEYAEAYNFGPRAEDARPVSWLVEETAALWGDGASWRMDVAGDQPHEAHFLRLDISKAAQRLHWHPVVGLDLALELTVDWARGVAGGEDPRALTLRQIERYQQSLIGAVSN